jgi:repressor LexA
MLKIKEIRTLKKISAKKLAEYLNIDKKTLSAYEDGTLKPNFKTIEAIADFFDISIETIMGGLKTSKESSVRIPILDSLTNVIPLSSLTDIEDFNEEMEYFSSTCEYIALRMEGNDMSPRFDDGDIIIIRGDYLVPDDAIAVVVIDDTDVYCRRIYKTDNGLDLVADNPDTSKYKTKHFYNHDIHGGRVRIIGKVIEARKSF